MMRLRQLSIDFFGHFTGKSFDFGAAQPGRSDFHVIYGPNEAGKSTTMEAFLRLLYGFPAREPFDFLHQRKNLQVSGLLEIDGVPKTLSRLPKRNSPLVDAHGAALPEAMITAHLGGLSEVDYRQLLCLDDETIERGGEEIASSKGDIGRLLFSAAAGISDLTGALDQIRGQADGLYKSRSSKTRLAELKRALTDTERAIKELDIPASLYRKLVQASEAATFEENELRGKRETLQRTQMATDALTNALPLLGKIDRLDRDLAPFADYPEALKTPPEDLVRLLTDQAKATTEASRLQDEIDSLSDQRAALERHPGHLSLSEQLEALDPLHARHTTADADLDRRRARRDDILSQMRHIARDLGAPQADPLQLALPQIRLSELAEARENRRNAQAAAQAERAEILRLTTRRKALETLRDQLTQSDNTSQITDIFARFDVDMLVPRHAAAAQTIEEAKTRLRDALDALSYKGLQFDTLPNCPLTPQEADLLAGEYKTQHDQNAQLSDSLSTLKQKTDVLRAQIEQIKADLALDDDAAAHAQLKSRDRLWQQHKTALSTQTADTFEAAMISVDQTAKMRLANARELGEMRHKSQHLIQLTTEHDHTNARLIASQQKLNALVSQTKNAARSIGLPDDITAQALAHWVTAWAEATQAKRQLRHIREKQGPVLHLSGRLATALQPLFGFEGADFDMLLAAARKRQTKEKTHLDRIAELRSNLSLVTAELKDREASQIILDQVAEETDNLWRGLITDTFGDNSLCEALVRSLAPLQEMHSLAENHRNAAHQVASMERDQNDFATRVAKLAEAYALANSDDPLATFATLHQHAKDAQAAEQNFDALTRQIETKIKDCDTAQSILQKIDQEVGSLAKLFPPHVSTETLPDLRNAVAEAHKADQFRFERDESATQLCTLLSVSSLEKARDLLSDADPSALAAKVQSLANELGTLEARLDDATSIRINAERDLRDVTGEADVAALVEKKATLELQIEETALQFLELEFGHRLAEEAIRRYRDTHRSAMLAATERAFASLTNGAYSQLRTQPDGSNDILLAIDASGTAKQAQDMSKGTRFQLYLALRAAAYEQLSSQGITLPFFCDDIFETFDEERTRAACRVMERIGLSGQAIYLTHHRHVVDIARQACPAGVSVHEL